MTVVDVLVTEQGLTLLGSVLGGLWTLFKTSEWWQRRRDKRYAAAVDVLEAAVDDTYRTYVRAIKEARDDGKLSRAERKRARDLARERAVELGRTEGVDVLRELGQTYVDLWVSRLVRRMKRGE